MPFIFFYIFEFDMRKSAYTSCIIALLTLLPAAIHAGLPDYQLPYGFIENKGQFTDATYRYNPDVKYVLQVQNIQVQLKKNGLSYVLIRKAQASVADSVPSNQITTKPKAIIDSFNYKEITYRIDLNFKNANPNSAIQEEGVFDDYINYFTAGTPEAGITYVHHYRKIVYKDIYPNIDVEFITDTENATAFKYNFIVHPGGHVSDIQLEYLGANTSLQSDGKITLQTPIGNLEEKIPLSFSQHTADGEKKKVDVKYKKHGVNTYRFNCEPYDAQATLIIDPIVWATYFGGENRTIGRGIEMGADKSIVFGGHTNSITNLASSGAHQTSFGGDQDAFLAKFSSKGLRLWSTFYGAAGYESFESAIAVSKQGNIYIGGSSVSASGIATSGAFQTVLSGPSDCYLAKFSAAGVRIWSTYIGGDESEAIYDLKCDTNENIYSCGFTKSTNNIATSGGFQNTKMGGTQEASGFLMKFSPYGTRIWGTYYGSVNGSFHFSEVTIDPSQNILTFSILWRNDTLLTTPGCYQRTLSGEQDILIVKFNPYGARLWATYYGGVYSDIAEGIETDVAGNVYITGHTTSPGGISTPGSHRAAISQSRDCFLTKFTPSGQLVWGTYWGGAQTEYCHGITINDSNDLFIVGRTYSEQNIPTPNAIQSSYGGESDGFIARFDSAGVLKMATYYGGPDIDFIYEGACDHVGGAVFLGTTYSSTNIATPGAFRTTLLGEANAFLLKLSDCSHVFTLSANSSVCEGSEAVFTPSPSGTAGGCKYRWTGPNGLDTIAQTLRIKNIPLNAAGTYRVIRFDSGSTCIDTSFLPLQIYPKPKAGYQTNQLVQCLRDNLLICTDTSSLLNGTLTRTWISSLGDTATSPSFSKTFSSTGSYEIKLLVKSNNNCTDSTVKTLTVHPSAVVGFNSTKTSSCGSHEFLFSDTSKIETGSYTILWEFNDTTGTDTAIVSKKYVAEGSYSVKLITTSDKGCVDSSVLHLNLPPPFYQPHAGYLDNGLSSCQAKALTFTDTTYAPAQDSMGRIWEFSDGILLQDSIINRQFNGFGTYSVKLKTFTKNGCADSSIRTVKIYPQTKAGFSINHSTQCLRNNFIFIDTSKIDTGSFSILWQTGNGNTFTADSISISYLPGNYTVTQITTTNFGCKDTVQKNITVLPFPTPVAGFNENMLKHCLQENVFIFSDTSSISAGTLSRRWDFGDSTTAQSIQVSKSYSRSGSYMISLHIQSEKGCSDSAKKQIDVFPQPSAKFTANSLTSCLRDNRFIFTDSSYISSGSLSQVWYAGDNTSGSGTIFNKSFAQHGSFLITMVVTSDKNCVDTFESAVDVFPQTNIGFTSTTSAEQCDKNNSFYFLDTSRIQIGYYSRVWDFGDGETDTSLFATHHYNNPGKYLLKLITISDKGCKDSLLSLMNVFQQPMARIDVNDTIQCYLNHSYIFTDSTYASSKHSRMWNLGDGNLQTNSSFIKQYSDTGTYLVRLSVADENNCTDTDDVLVRILPNPSTPRITSVSHTTISCTPAYKYQWYLDGIPIRFSNRQHLPISQNGTYAVTVDSTNGCKNTSQDFEVLFFNDGVIKIYPNPNRGNFTIDFRTLQGEKRIFVTDVIGREVGYYTTLDSSKSFNLGPYLPKGVYFIEIHSQAGILVKKIVVQ